MRLGALLGVGVIGLLVCVVMAPRVLGLKPDRQTYDMYDMDEEIMVSGTVVIPTAAAGPNGPPDVFAVDSQCIIYPDYDITECSGSVKNLRAENLQRVEVVVTLLSDDGKPQSTETSRIDYDPLLPDQESPWLVEAPFNPAFDRYSISFRAGGQTLNAGQPTP